MSSRITASLGALFAAVLQLKTSYAATTCADACGSTSTDCIVFNDNVVGCYGTFSGPVSDSALSLCNRNNQEWNICESGNYAYILGLDADNDCQSSVPQNHVFWSLAATGENEQYDCASNSGEIGDAVPFNNVWGCAGGGTYIPGTYYSRCGTQGASFNLMIDAGANADYTNYGLEFCGGYTSACDGSEQILLEALDDSKYGVMCCASDPVFEEPASCDDVITLVDFYYVPRYQARGFYNFAPYLGQFYYTGSDSNGYPRYVNWQSPGNAEISVIEEPVTGLTVLSLTIPNYGVYYINSTDGGEATFVATNTYQVSASLFEAQELQVYLDEALYDGLGELSHISVFEDDIRVRLLFNDCTGGQGFQKSTDTPNPTQSPIPTPDPTPYPTPNPTTPHPSTPNPTPNPTTPSPTTLGECSNYDDTVYSDCNGDIHCVSCQPWGCAQCETGYYKMGNLMRCQSCSDNYPNCANCGDGDGCVGCNSGYVLQMHTGCDDETCQLEP